MSTVYKMISEERKKEEENEEEKEEEKKQMGIVLSSRDRSKSWTHLSVEHARAKSRPYPTKTHEGVRARSEAVEAICYAWFPRFRRRHRRRRRLSPTFHLWSSFAVFTTPTTSSLPPLRRCFILYTQEWPLLVFNRLADLTNQWDYEKKTKR